MSSPNINLLNTLASKAYAKCAETLAAFRLGKSTVGDRASVPTSASPKSDSSSPSRPPKRPRDEDNDVPSSGQDPTPPTTSLPKPRNPESCPESDGASSPSKRRKCEAESNSAEDESRTSQTKKRVRFHPEVADNSLWADLYCLKRKDERKKRNNTPAPEADQNTTAQTTSRPSSAPPPVHPSVNGCSPPKRPRTTPRRRNLSRERAKQFLSKSSWQNGNSFFYIDKRSDEESDSDSDGAVFQYPMHTRVRGGAAVGSTSEPGPSTRRIPDLDDIDTDDDDDDDDDDEKQEEEEKEEVTPEMRERTRQDAEDGLPSAFHRPVLSRFGTFSGKPMARPIAEASNPSTAKPNLSVEEAAANMTFLESALNRLPANDARKAFEALEALTRWYGYSNFVEGLKQGAHMEKVKSQKSSQKSDSKVE